jgi:hypothetical protein
MTRQATDRWLGIGVLLVIVLTVITAVWATRFSATPPVAIEKPAVTDTPTYREVAIKSISQEVPRAIATRDHTIYVAGDRAIQTLNRVDGARGRMIQLNSPPTALAVSHDGTLYAGMGDHVDIYDANLTRTARWPARPKMYITALVADTDAVWAADAGNKIVVGYDHAGKVITELGQKDAARGIPGLLTPNSRLDLALSPKGEILVTNPGHHRVETYDRKGKLLRAWGMPSSAPGGFAGCCNPVAIAVAPDGSVITAEKGVQRMQRFGTDGTYAGLVSTLGAGAEWDLAVNARGEILLLDPKAKLVRIYQRDAGVSP